MSHHCHWPGCKTKVHPRLWGCSRHWFALPGWLRDWIWDEYRSGQEIGKNPSGGYMDAFHCARGYALRANAEKVA